LPSIFGNININSNLGTINFGDTLVVTLKRVEKIIAGPTGGVGNLVITLNGPSINNVLDPNLVDNFIV
jgi:spore germination protein PF